MLRPAVLLTCLVGSAVAVDSPAVATADAPLALQAGAPTWAVQNLDDSNPSIDYNATLPVVTPGDRSTGGDQTVFQVELFGAQRCYAYLEIGSIKYRMWFIPAASDALSVTMGTRLYAKRIDMPNDRSRWRRMYDGLQRDRSGVKAYEMSAKLLMKEWSTESFTPADKAGPKGSPDAPIPDASFYPQVTFARDYWLCETEATMQMWDQVVGGKPTTWGAATNLDELGWCDLTWDAASTKPVVAVLDEEVDSFVSTLTTTTGAQIALPSEAEWELACRAGSNHAFAEDRMIDFFDGDRDGDTGEVFTDGELPFQVFGDALDEEQHRDDNRNMPGQMRWLNNSHLGRPMNGYDGANNNYDPSSNVAGGLTSDPGWHVLDDRPLGLWSSPRFSNQSGGPAIGRYLSAGVPFIGDEREGPGVPMRAYDDVRVAAWSGNGAAPKGSGSTVDTSDPWLISYGATKGSANNDWFGYQSDYYHNSNSRQRTCTLLPDVLLAHDGSQIRPSLRAINVLNRPASSRSADDARWRSHIEVQSCAVFDWRFWYPEHFTGLQPPRHPIDPYAPTFSYWDHDPANDVDRKPAVHTVPMPITGQYMLVTNVERDNMGLYDPDSAFVAQVAKTDVQVVNYRFGYAVTPDGDGDGLADIPDEARNAWGLIHMHGNVAEMVRDRWNGRSPYLHAGPIDAATFEETSELRYRVVRGGSWFDPAAGVRSAARSKVLRQAALANAVLIGQCVSDTVGFRFLIYH